MQSMEKYLLIAMLITFCVFGYILGCGGWLGDPNTNRTYASHQHTTGRYDVYYPMVNRYYGPRARGYYVYPQYRYYPLDPYHYIGDHTYHYNDVYYTSQSPVLQTQKIVKQPVTQPIKVKEKAPQKPYVNPYAEAAAQQPDSGIRTFENKPQYNPSK